MKKIIIRRSYIILEIVKNSEKQTSLGTVKVNKIYVYDCVVKRRLYGTAYSKGASNKGFGIFPTY